jgi:polysaccharide biosynthesis protein PslH
MNRVLSVSPSDLPLQTDESGAATEMTKLKVLVLDEEIPYPPNAGKRIRTWNLLRRLAERHNVCLLCYGRWEDPAAKALQKAGIQLHLVEPPAKLDGWHLYLKLFANLFSLYPFSVTKHYSKRFQEAVNSLLEKAEWDLIQCEWTPYARFLPLRSPAPTLVMTHNVESEILKRRALHARNPFAKSFFRMQEWKMRRFERRALLRASAVAAVTTPDVEMERSWGVASISLIPNGVDLELYSPGLQDEREDEILILGSLDWYANVDALNYFLDDIFPLIRAHRPQVRLQVVGRRPPEAVRARLSQVVGVDFVGEVEDTKSYFQRASVVVVPLRIGGGSRIKILEALACGKAVVSTAVGAEGLEVVDGEHLAIADSPQEFAARVAELLEAKDKRRCLGDQGRLLVQRRYGWDGIASKLECAWREASRTSQAVANDCVQPRHVQVET